MYLLRGPTQTYQVGNESEGPVSDLLLIVVDITVCTYIIMLYIHWAKKEILAKLEKACPSE